MGLAEPKRKVKYSIDPNAHHWSKNEAKFGAKLMKKMGWEEGKGLGANEDGMTEHIKIKFKDDTKGVGYSKNDYDDVWMDHQDDFEDLLKNLKGAAGNNSDNSSSNEDESAAKASILNLEHRSKEAKTSHLRHPKLIKAKNLSKATNNDLDCILGTKKRKMKKEAEAEENETGPVSTKMDDESESECERRACFKMNDAPATSSNSSENKLLDSMSSVFTTNSQSIGDYFKNKMRAKLGLPVEAPVAEEPVVEEEEEVEVKKKSKKSKKSKKEEPEPTVEDEEPAPVIEEPVEEPEVKKKKKHKKSKEVQDDEAADSCQNSNGHNADQECFPGSNLLDINGYTPYVITASTDALINERLKKAKAKQAVYQKNVEKDANFYAMSKKSKHLE